MKLFYTVCVCLALVACGGDDLRRGFSAEADGFIPDDRPTATTLVYACKGYEFVARLGPGEIALWLPERYVILSQVRSASGTLYEEDDISFWSKGEEAMLTVEGQNYQNCHLLPERVAWEDARRRGVDFRGVGNDPGWSLEIQRGRQLLFILEGGAQRILVPDQTEDGEDLMYFYAGATATQNLRVNVLDLPCVDAISGDTFPTAVTVMFNGTVYQGCGQNLYYPWVD
ncbi:MAG: MliC family protein [Halioglobus sp.]|nr:MliC family protein [Halioglobus sp.]